MSPTQCGAKKRDGTPCKLPPMRDATRCRLHGGKSPRAQAKAAERRQQAEIMRALGEVPDQNVDPAEALLRLVSMKHTEMLWLRAKVQEIGDTPASVDPDDPGAGAHSSPQLTYGLTKHDTGIGPQGPVDQRTYEVAPNIWWRLLREAEDQLAKYTTAALRAGVERRQIELQEAQALHLAQAIHRILDALHLTAEQAKQVPTVVPEILRQLPVTTAQEDHQ